MKTLLKTLLKTLQKANFKIRGASGQVLPLMAVFLGLTVGVMLLVAALGSSAVRISQADTAADMTALAVASSFDASVASQIALANGHELQSLTFQEKAPGICEITVQVVSQTSGTTSSATSLVNRLCPPDDGPQ